MTEQEIKEKVNPIVGYIFHSAKQLGLDNAPASMDWEYLKEGTRRIVALLESEKYPTEKGDQHG